MQTRQEKNHGPGPIPAEQQLLSKAQLGHVLGVTARTIDNWVRHRKIPSIPITARCRRFIAGDVIAALRRLETEVAP
jgi:hypothetical protein